MTASGAVICIGRDRVVALPLDAGDPNIPNDVAEVVTHACTRWLKNEEVLTVLQNFQGERAVWPKEAAERPQGGRLFIFSRKVCRGFRNDKHNWRKKSDGRTVKETHEKLKVGDKEKLNCYYAHAEAGDGLQRRCYWILDTPYDDVILVHYLCSSTSRVGGGQRVAAAAAAAAAAAPLPNSIRPQRAAAARVRFSAGHYPADSDEDDRVGMEPRPQRYQQLQQQEAPGDLSEGVLVEVQPLGGGSAAPAAPTGPNRAAHVDVRYLPRAKSDGADPVNFISNLQTWPGNSAAGSLQEQYVLAGEPSFQGTPTAAAEDATPPFTTQMSLGARQDSVQGFGSVDRFGSVDQGWLSASGGLPRLHSQRSNAQFARMFPEEVGALGTEPTELQGVPLPGTSYVANTGMSDGAGSTGVTEVSPMYPSRADSAKKPQPASAAREAAVAPSPASLHTDQAGGAAADPVSLAQPSWLPALDSSGLPGDVIRNGQQAGQDAGGDAGAPEPLGGSPAATQPGRRPSKTETLRRVMAPGSRLGGLPRPGSSQGLAALARRHTDSGDEEAPGSGGAARRRNPIAAPAPPTAQDRAAAAATAAAAAAQGHREARLAQARLGQTSGSSAGGDSGTGAGPDTLGAAGDDDVLIEPPNLLWRSHSLVVRYPYAYGAANTCDVGGLLKQMSIDQGPPPSAFAASELDPAAETAELLLRDMSIERPQHSSQAPAPQQQQRREGDDASPAPTHNGAALSNTTQGAESQEGPVSSGRSLADLLDVNLSMATGVAEGEAASAAPLRNA